MVGGLELYVASFNQTESVLAEDQKSAMVPLDYAARVKQYRARLGLTQVELSARLGVSFATVNRWENGPDEAVTPVVAAASADG